MKVAIIGSRNFQDYDLLKKLLVEEDITQIISGGAPGADTLAKQYAEEKDIPFQEYKAQWNDLTHSDAVIKVNKYGNKYDARAGFRRNDKIIEGADKIIVFWDGTSPGTLDSLKKAKKLKKKIKIIKYLLL